MCGGGGLGEFAVGAVAQVQFAGGFGGKRPRIGNEQRGLLARTQVGGQGGRDLNSRMLVFSGMREGYSATALAVRLADAAGGAGARRRRDRRGGMVHQRQNRTEVGLDVAEDGERLVHIEELAHLRGAPSPRPVFACPGCGEPVFPRLGPIRRGHFAHKGRGDCWALTPEGRLHLAAKQHLAAELGQLDDAGRAALGLPVRCGEDGSTFRAPPDLFRCPAHDRHNFGPWTKVLVEKRDSLTTRRPDIKLVDQFGDTVLAIEIVHRHPVDEAKAAELFTAGVRWVEVDVADERFAEVMAWSSTNCDLPCSRSSIDFAWRCREHGNALATVFFRFVDSYFPHGKGPNDHSFRRDTLWVVRRWEQAREVSNTLWRRVGNGQPECLGVESESGRTIGEIFAESRRGAEAAEPTGTDRDESPWRSLEHLPAGERDAYVVASALDFQTFPRRRRWDGRVCRFVWSKSILPLAKTEIEAMALAMFGRMVGHDKPWPDTPRNPYEVPVISAGLRAAWLADAVWEGLERHMSGEDPIPGVEHFTKDELWKRIRGGDPARAAAHQTTKP